MQISQFFVNGDIKGAIAYMRDHEEFKDILPAYVTIFEDQKYRTYEIPDNLNDILWLYQIYFGTPYRCNNTSGFWLHLPPTTSFTRERICCAPCSQVYIKYNLRVTTKYVTLEKKR